VQSEVETQESGIVSFTFYINIVRVFGLESLNLFFSFKEHRKCSVGVFLEVILHLNEVFHIRQGFFLHYL
jgi:hypothetical protein